MKNPENISSLSGNLLEGLLRDLVEEETRESSFETRFTSVLQEIVRKMSPRGREILQKLIQQAAGDKGRLPGLYRYICTMALLSATGQSYAPLRVPDKVIDFFVGHGDMPGCLVHCDVCRKCGAMVPFLNYYRENRLLRPFETCPVCGKKLI